MNDKSMQLIGEIESRLEELKAEISNEESSEGEEESSEGEAPEQSDVPPTTQTPAKKPLAAMILLARKRMGKK